MHGGNRAASRASASSRATKCQPAPTSTGSAVATARVRKDRRNARVRKDRRNASTSAATSDPGECRTCPVSTVR